MKPALDLGVDRVVVIATHSIAPRWGDGYRHVDARPDFADGAVHLLQAALVDPMTEDVRRLGTTNLLVEGARTPTALDDYRRAKGKAPYRRIPYMFVAPSTRGALGDTASAVFARRFGAWRGATRADMAILSRLLGGESEQHGELISHVLFDPAFHDEIIEQGRRDAHRWFDRVNGPTNRGTPTRSTHCLTPEPTTGASGDRLDVLTVSRGSASATRLLDTTGSASPAHWWAVS